MDHPQIVEIKKALVNQVATSYRALIAALKDIPGNPHQKSQAFIHFDSGFLWLKESIWSAQMSIGEPIPSTPSCNVDNPEVKDPDKVDNVDVGEPHPSIPHVPEPSTEVAPDGC